MGSRSEASSRSIAALLEDVLGCKWSWSVLRSVYRGVLRPGQLERDIPGISTKVLNERLRKLVAHGVLARTEFAEIPPHVEYRFTELGQRFFSILQEIEALEREHDEREASRAGVASGSRPRRGG